MPVISPMSVVDPHASLADDVEVGPFCVIGANVTIDAGCKLISHVVLLGHTTLDKNNTLHPHVVLGSPPQDKKHRGDNTRLEIGHDNQIRESVTIHVGTDRGGGITRIGNNNLLMVNSHIGHDAQLGDNCVLANNCMIAGHVVCGNFVNMMGGVGVHHFVTIGDYAYIGGAARLHHDVPPYVKVDGADQVRGLNEVGLRRAGFTEEDLAALQEACRKLFYHRKPFAHAMAEFELTNGINPHVKRMVEFLRRRDQGVQGRYLESLRQ